VAETMTSLDDAGILQEALLGFVDGMETHGFTRSQIGAAMVGVGAGVVGAHLGIPRLLDVLEGARKAACNT